MDREMKIILALDGVQRRSAAAAAAAQRQQVEGHKTKRCVSVRDLGTPGWVSFTRLQALKDVRSLRRTNGRGHSLYRGYWRDMIIKYRRIPVSFNSFCFSGTQHGLSIHTQVHLEGGSQQLSPVAQCMDLLSAGGGDHPETGINASAATSSRNLPVK